MAAKRKTVDAPKDSGQTITLPVKGKNVVFGVGLIGGVADCANFINRMVGLSSGQNEQEQTVLGYLLKDGKLAFKSVAELNDKLVGMDIISAYKRISSVNGLDRYTDAIREENGLQKK